MQVRLVTTWDIPCGIAEHSAYLKAAVEAADPSIVVTPHPEALDPAVLTRGLDWTGILPNVLHLNYHAGLHSRWTPREIQMAKARGLQVLVTYHDTGTPNTDQTRAICQAASAVVVHEPADDLDCSPYYWRMGVPDWHQPLRLDLSLYGQRPVLGSIGFPFPWKNYDQLARITAENGWALLLIAPTATSEQIRVWEAYNPHLQVYPHFVPRATAISLLSACDATAFTYVCHNTGQSAALLQGVAARKPVLALSTCRQFRALFNDPLGRTTITWCDTFEDVSFALSHFVRLERVSPAVVALAEQESWAHLGRKYATLYHELSRA